jgi:quercetin dioxygenase-like cupin family protein
MVIHRPEQAAYRSVLPEEIDWKPFPAFPPSARLAIVVGDPSEPETYVIRVKVPSNVKLTPHQHPEHRVYTVISGVFYIGLGSVFDEERLLAYPPGAVVVLPGGTPHFTGRNLEPTLPKCRPSDRWDSNTSSRSTIPGASENATPP